MAPLTLDAAAPGNDSCRLGRIGLIVLSSDEVGEAAFHDLLPRDRVSCFTTRVGWDEGRGMAGLRAVEEDVTAAAANLVPMGRLDAIAFSCTNGTIAIGEEALRARLRALRPEAVVTTPPSAALRALAALNAVRVILISPYPTPIHDAVEGYLLDRGLEIVASGTFAATSDADMALVPPRAIAEAAAGLAREPADAVFISCTGWRATDAIERIEHETGLPVVTSTQALAWDSMRQLGVDEPISNYGRLLQAF